MSNLFSTPLILVAAWLVAVVLCLPAVCFHLYRLCSSRRAGGQVLAWSVALTSTVGLCAAAAAEWAQRPLQPATAPTLLGMALMMVLVLVGSRLQFLSATGLAEVSTKRQRFVTLAAMLFVAVVTVRSAVQLRLTERSLNVDSATVLWAAPGQPEALPERFAITDRGSLIALHHWKAPEQEFERYASVITTPLLQLYPSIQVGNASKQSNCHGWVFTGGEFVLATQDIDKILSDNGYEQVADANPGDIVIYRGFQGEVLHTGLVRGVLDDGTVIVESKWGVAGRYLHRPEDQPYGQQFAYYRSPREGHLLQILSEDSGRGSRAAATLTQVRGSGRALSGLASTGRGPGQALATH
jgi:hypothetical protein